MSVVFAVGLLMLFLFAPVLAMGRKSFLLAAIQLATLGAATADMMLNPNLVTMISVPFVIGAWLVVGLLTWFKVASLWPVQQRRL